MQGKFNISGLCVIIATMKVALIKTDGCNKLNCKCGYKMCYICREDIRHSGYSHFCQHFREKPGSCEKCVKCDLWKSIDEADIIHQVEREILEKFS